jgi:hypothetical protein
VAEFKEDAMSNQHKGHDQTRDPRTGRPPLPGNTEKNRRRKTRIELEENEDLEVDEGTEAARGNPESPDNTGAERKTIGKASMMTSAITTRPTLMP